MGGHSRRPKKYSTGSPAAGANSRKQPRNSGEREITKQLVLEKWFRDSNVGFAYAARS
jgi:hypothetical protein